MSVPLGNTSASGGYLTPTSPVPLDDLCLDTVIGGLIAGVTGLPPEVILPRWQPTQPRIPDVDETWVAVGVNVSTPDDTPAQIHHGEGDGYTVLRTFYRLDVLASFYGPRSDGYARLTHDAFYVGQNREAMRAAGLNLIGFEPIRRVPAIEATQSRRRSDFAFRLTQVVERRYEIRNVRELDGGIRAASGPRLLTNVLRTVPPTGA